ncbi:hypothetical protein GCM10010206_24950 [Streptomyces cinerochromogenes]|nr:hypothetical protein GCM10010206_24950 [Streptomyces cinerochromogenes]
MPPRAAVSLMSRAGTDAAAVAAALRSRCRGCGGRPLDRAGRPYPVRGARADDGLVLRNGDFHTLDRRACLRLLGGVPVGRVVYTQQALPAVLPVNFRLDTDSSVVLRTAAGSELVRAVDGAVVAFEADEFDAVTHSGWSVVVTGRAALVTDPAEHERLARYGPDSWMPVGDGVFVRIESDMVTGRRLSGT